MYVKVNGFSIMLSLFSDVQRGTTNLQYRGGRFFVSKQNTSEKPISLIVLVLSIRDKTSAENKEIFCNCRNYNFLKGNAGKLIKKI